jgi:hypothetical protein
LADGDEPRVARSCGVPHPANRSHTKTPYQLSAAESLLVEGFLEREGLTCEDIEITPDGKLT